MHSEESSYILILAVTLIAMKQMCIRDRDTDVGRIVKICKESAIPYFILGNGSNLLVGDGGYRGAVIQIYKNMSAVTVEGTEITVQAGALLSSVAAAAKNAALTGFEFAGGIPGTMGGAVVMNAGAYGGEMKDVLTEVTVMDEEGEIVTLCLLYTSRCV